jgi:hypothetical protein
MIVLLALVLFRPRISGYSGPAINLMDLQEFRKLPSDLKSLYTSQMLRLTDAFFTPIANDWVKTPPANKAALKNYVQTYVDQRVPQLVTSQNLGQSIAILNPNQSVSKPVSQPMPRPGPQVNSGYELGNIYGMQMQEPEQQYGEEGYTSYFVR